MDPKEFAELMTEEREIHRQDRLLQEATIMLNALRRIASRDSVEGQIAAEAIAQVLGKGG